MKGGEDTSSGSKSYDGWHLVDTPGENGRDDTDDDSEYDFADDEDLLMEFGSYFRGESNNNPDTNPDTEYDFADQDSADKANSNHQPLSPEFNQYSVTQKPTEERDILPTNPSEHTSIISDLKKAFQKMEPGFLAISLVNPGKNYSICLYRYMLSMYCKKITASNKETAILDIYKTLSSKKSDQFDSEKSANIELRCKFLLLKFLCVGDKKSEINKNLRNKKHDNLSLAKEINYLYEKHKAQIEAKLASIKESLNNATPHSELVTAARIRKMIGGNGCKR